MIEITESILFVYNEYYKVHNSQSGYNEPCL